MAYDISLWLEPGDNHTVGYGAASYIFGSGVAQVTFGDTPYIIDLNTWENDNGYGVGGASDVKNIGSTPIGLYSSSGSNTHAGQQQTLSPTKIIDFVHDGPYTVQSTDGDYFVGTGKFELSLGSLASVVIDMAKLDANSVIPVSTGDIITAISSNATGQLGNLNIANSFYSGISVDVILEAGDSYTVPAGNSASLIYLDGVVDLETNSSATIIDSDKGGINAPILLGAGDTFEMLSGVMLLSSNP